MLTILARLSITDNYGDSGASSDNFRLTVEYVSEGTCLFLFNQKGHEQTFVFGLNE